MAYLISAMDPSDGAIGIVVLALLVVAVAGEVIEWGPRCKQTQSKQ